MLRADWLLFSSFDPFLCECKHINRTGRLAVELVPVEFITTRLSLRIVVFIKYIAAVGAAVIKYVAAADVTSII